jgi:hypothetical protein
MATSDRRIPDEISCAFGEALNSREKREGQCRRHARQIPTAQMSQARHPVMTIVRPSRPITITGIPLRSHNAQERFLRCLYHHPAGLERAQEVHQILLFLSRQADAEATIIEIYHVHQSTGRPIVEIRRSRR